MVDRDQQERRDGDRGREGQTRRGFIKTAGTVAGAAAMGLAGVRLSPEAAWAAEVPGATASERAINGVKMLQEAGQVKKGEKLTFFFHEGIFGNFTGNNNELRDEWVKLTGVEFEIVGVPIEKSIEKVMLEGVTKSGAYDVMMSYARAYADLYEAGAIEDMTPFVKKYDPVLTAPPDPDGIPQVKAITEYKGMVVALPVDGDFMLLYLRKDLMEDPEKKKAYEDKFGRALKAPDTWKEYDEMCLFFNDPDNDFYGSMTPMNIFWGGHQWMIRFASKANPNMYYFDDDMKPLINSPEGVESTVEYIEALKYQHPGALNRSFTEDYPDSAQGHTFSMVFAASFGKFSNAPEFSSTVGKWGYHLVPGTVVGDKLVRRSMYITGNPIHLAKHSKRKELAYLYMQWITSPEIGPRSIASVGGYADPYRLSHYKSEIVQKSYPPAELDAHLANAYLSVPDAIPLPGSNEYYAVLDKNIQEAAVGNMTPEECMKVTAEAWEGVTERKGRDKQIEAWKSLKETFPTQTEPKPM